VTKLGPFPLIEYLPCVCPNLIESIPLEELMPDNKIEKVLKALPVSFEEFESFPKHVEEFFDLIAGRPFELLENASWNTCGRPNRNCSAQCL
jgi:hypothetical protein